MNHLRSASAPETRYGLLAGNGEGNMGTQQDPIALAEAGQGLLDEARGNDAGRAGRTLTPGAGSSLKQSLLALTAGASLQDHASPGAATIQVLIGAARLTSEGASTSLLAGEWARIPDAVHALEATEDLVVLLTVASAL